MMGVTTTDEWVDEAILWGLPWVVNAPMTPKAFKVFWERLPEDDQYDYVISAFLGRPFPFPSRQMLPPKPKKLANLSRQAWYAIRVIDRYTLHY